MPAVGDHVRQMAQIGDPEPVRREFGAATRDVENVHDMGTLVAPNARLVNALSWKTSRTRRCRETPLSTVPGVHDSILTHGTDSGAGVTESPAALERLGAVLPQVGLVRAYRGVQQLSDAVGLPRAGPSGQDRVDTARAGRDLARVRVTNSAQSGCSG